MHVYVGLPEDDKGRIQNTYLFKKETDKNGNVKMKRVRQVLWGDYLKVDGQEGDYHRVVWSPKKNPETLYFPKAHAQESRPLEIIFLDVGQGDGAVLISSETNEDERIMVIDAGEGDHMARFLNGRFKAYRGFDFHAAVITHTDADHYLGFEDVFADHDISFKKVYHNGLLEAAVSGQFDKLGGTSKSEAIGTTVVNRLVETDAEAKALYKDTPPDTDYWFPGLMLKALGNPNIGNFEMLSTAHGSQVGGQTYMPGFAPHDGRQYTIEVLGPVPEKDETGALKLRKIGKYGETKNGHSILLRLQFGAFSVLFGGDLNEKAEKYLLKHYTGSKSWPKTGSAAYTKMVDDARTRFRSDIFKVCHHGSEKVTDAFMDAVNPAAFVISSGDQEGHVHPRPDLLGRLGRFGRGEAPVILSTELQRSTREKEDMDQVARLKRRVDSLYKSPAEGLREAIKEEIAELGRTNVDVYGAIYVKTDGKRMMAAFKKEQLSETDKWFAFNYRFDDNSDIVPI